MKKILITGGMGYLGGRIGKHLSQNGYYVVLADLIKDAAKPEWLQGEITNIDIFNAENLKTICKEVDTIIHLAAPNEIESGKAPHKAIEVCALGTLNLLSAAKEMGVRRFIYFSTAHIYGSPLVGKIDELTLPRPVHPYSISHKIAEDLVIAENDNKNIEGVVLRLSNSFGAPVRPEVDRWTLVFNDLCRQAVQCKSLTLKSSGMQYRDFITLTEVTNAVQHMIEIDNTKLSGNIFNLGGRLPLRIIDVAELIASRYEKITGFKLGIKRQEPVPDEYYENIDYKIDKLLNTGFNPLGSPEKEVDELITYCLDVFK